MNQLTIGKLKGLTTFDLKIIGIVLMFIDHIHQMFVPMGAPDWLDWFGRPVATLFFFVSVVGFTHTRDKKKYMLRLYLGMLVMSFGNQFIQQWVGYEEVQLINNIFRDLLVGTIMMYGVDNFAAGVKKKSVGRVLWGILLVLFPLITSGIILSLINNPATIMVGVWVNNFIPAMVFTENSFMVILIPLMYIARKYRWVQCLLIALAALFFFTQGSTQWMMVFAILPIALFNGQKGPGMRNFFYFFYPLHIWLLYLISAYLYMH